MIRNPLKDERGISLVMAAILIVVLIGMTALAVDVGRLYAARQYLVNSCDASALAGGLELPDQAKAEAEASECAVANDMSQHQVSFPADGITPEGATKIRVDGQMTVDHTFARILGFDNKLVSAYAVVLKTGPVGSVAGRVVPWGIPWYSYDGTPYEYNNGVLYTLKVGSQTDLGDGSTAKTGGNFYPLALQRSLGDGSSGGDVYMHDIMWGFDGTVEVGDITDTEPGNMVGPTKQAVVNEPSGDESLFERAQQEPWADDTWDNYDYGNPRIVIVPIISPLGNGRTGVEILGFASFWVESCSGGEVHGYFLDYTIPGGGGSGPDYGVFTFKLIE
ncbi:MAG: Tad domain-containing protein [Armatimonadota bacterium]|nr:MAG: Tad domain-containing protein [Armatimonadota bacterium]